MFAVYQRRYSHRHHHTDATVYPKKYAHGFVVLCFVVVMQLFIMNSHEVFIHIPQGCFAGTGAIVRLPQCQWSKPDGYGKISQCITTTKHSKAKTVCIFLGIYSTCSKVLLYNTTSFQYNFRHCFLFQFFIRITGKITILVSVGNWCLWSRLYKRGISRRNV